MKPSPISPSEANAIIAAVRQCDAALEPQPRAQIKIHGDIPAALAKAVHRHNADIVLELNRLQAMLPPCPSEIFEHAVQVMNAKGLAFETAAMLVLQAHGYGRFDDLVRHHQMLAAHGIARLMTQRPLCADENVFRQMTAKLFDQQLDSHGLMFYALSVGWPLRRLLGCSSLSDADSMSLMQRLIMARAAGNQPPKIDVYSDAAVVGFGDATPEIWPCNVSAGTPLWWEAAT